jgi:hypothetical protein
MFHLADHVVVADALAAAGKQVDALIEMGRACGAGVKAFERQ